MPQKAQQNTNEPGNLKDKLVIAVSTSWMSKHRENILSSHFTAGYTTRDFIKTDVFSSVFILSVTLDSQHMQSVASYLTCMAENR